MLLCVNSYFCDTDNNLTLRDRLVLAQDICHGMAFLHSMETSLPRLELNPFHVFVSHKIQWNYLMLRVFRTLGSTMLMKIYYC